MSEIEKMIDEMRYEAASTAKILERIPVDKFDWKPHQKSMSMKDLATHVAGLAEWPGLIASTDFLDFAAGTFKHPQINNTNDLLKVNNEGLEKSVEALKKMTTDDLKKKWALRKGDHVILELPKYSFIRLMALNHTYHHRAQLSVYLRLLDIPVPGIYGPSADEMK